jgi:cobalt-zinc-cadmium resistance protein CzcA
MYANSVSRVLIKPKKIVIATAIIFAGAIAMSIGIGKDFMPKLDEGSIWVNVQLPPGITLEKSQEIAAEIRAAAMQFDEVRLVAVQAGRNDEGTDIFTPSDHEVYIGIRPYSEWARGRRQRHLVAVLDAAFSQIPGIIAVGFSQPMIEGVREVADGADTDLIIRVFGNDLIEGRNIAENIIATLRDVRGAVGLAITQQPPTPQLQIEIDRMAIARHDFTVEQVTDFINIGIGGAPVGEVFIEDRVYDITARIREDMRSTSDQIGNLRLMNEDGAQIPLAQLANISTTTGESFISREMMRRMVTVQLNLRGRDMGSFVREAQAAIAQNVHYDPRQFSIEWGGEFENKERAYAHLTFIVPMVLLLIFLLLYGAFGKARQAGLVMIIVPLAVFGGMAALMLRGMTFNISSAVGFLGLFGIAITNGVLMISHINELRKKRMGLKHAVRDGVRHRFRPIVMTSIVAMLGLLPATLATTVGSDFQRPLATVIVYGLAFSVLLTLYVLPTFYYLIEARQVKRDRENSFELLREKEAGELV